MVLCLCASTAQGEGCRCTRGRVGWIRRPYLMEYVVKQDVMSTCPASRPYVYLPCLLAQVFKTSFLLASIPPKLHVDRHSDIQSVTPARSSSDIQSVTPARSSSGILPQEYIVGDTRMRHSRASNNIAEHPTR